MYVHTFFTVAFAKFRNAVKRMSGDKCAFISCNLWDSKLFMSLNKCFGSRDYKGKGFFWIPACSALSFFLFYAPRNQRTCDSYTPWKLEMVNVCVASLCLPNVPLWWAISHRERWVFFVCDTDGNAAQRNFLAFFEDLGEA